MAGPIALTSECCKTPCTEPESIQVPGPAGVAGTDGADGEDGVSPVTTVSAQFLMPAEGANVTVAVGNSEGLVPNQPVFVQTAGHMQVISKPNNISVILQNLENTASSLYPGNAAPTTAIPAGSLISPSGFQGNAGSMSGAAGGDLKGTYPNPTLSKPNTKGHILVGNGTDAITLAPGTNGNSLITDSTTASGLKKGPVDVGGGAASVTGVLPIANGGTGENNATDAFDALSPLATPGGMIYLDAGVNTELAIGSANTVLASDGSAPAWTRINEDLIDMASGPLPRYGLLGKKNAANFNVTTDQQIPIMAGVTRYIVRKIIVDNASISLTTAAGGIYPSPAKAGTALVAAAQVYSALTASNKFLELTLAGFLATDVVTAITLYFSLTTPQGAAATANIWVFGENLTP